MIGINLLRDTKADERRKYAREWAAAKLHNDPAFVACEKNREAARRYRAAHPERVDAATDYLRKAG